MAHAHHNEENRFQRFRARRKAQGMKELRLWIPDTKRPGFTKEMKRQLALVEKTSEDQDTLAFIEHASIMDMKKAMLAVMQECLLPELAEIKSWKSNNAWQP